MVYQTKEVPLLPPDSFLNDPCEKALGFKTPRELAINNRANLGCIKLHEAQNQEAREWKARQLKIYQQENKNDNSKSK